MCAFHGSLTEFTGQRQGLVLFFYHEFWRLNSGHQVWQWVPLPGDLLKTPVCSFFRRRNPFFKWSMHFFFFWTSQVSDGRMRTLGNVWPQNCLHEFESKCHRLDVEMLRGKWIVLMSLYIVPSFCHKSCFTHMYVENTHMYVENNLWSQQALSVFFFSLNDGVSYGFGTRHVS